ncbi:MAG: sensor histidine kinase [Polaromonas sp.]|nr:sensor histidine kinase [Polaromonas sp.]
MVRLFESFHRASNVGTIASTGLGLGLAIVKNAVTVHGGTIEVASSPGEGTCFTGSPADRLTILTPDIPVIQAKTSSKRSSPPVLIATMACSRTLGLA